MNDREAERQTGILRHAHVGWRQRLCSRDYNLSPQISVCLMRTDISLRCFTTIQSFQREVNRSCPTRCWVSRASIYFWACSPLKGNWIPSRIKRYYTAARVQIDCAWMTVQPIQRKNFFFIHALVAFIRLISPEHICVAFLLFSLFPSNVSGLIERAQSQQIFYCPPTVTNDDITFRSPLDCFFWISLLYFWTAPYHDCSNFSLNAQPGLLSTELDI